MGQIVSRPQVNPVKEKEKETSSWTIIKFIAFKFTVVTRTNKYY